MYTSDELLNQVNLFLEQIPGPREPQSLYAPMRYVLSLGGKRIRPVLMLLAYNLFRDDVETILPVACGLETYHNYTLLHDDLMDNADLRRGHETVHRRWDANTAILSGDSMLVLAYQYMARCPEKYLSQIMQLFTQTALEIGEGQQYDMDFEQRNDVREDEYIEMIRLKTSVLLACATKMGAVMGGAGEEEARLLYKFGEQIGLAFQLQDDYLDVYGDPQVFGKAIGGDIMCNKKTFMLINALNHANSEQREELERWLAADPQKEHLTEAEFHNQKVGTVTRLYNEMGIDKMAQQKIDYYYRESQKYLSALGVSEEQETELRKYAEQMMKRQN